MGFLHTLKDKGLSFGAEIFLKKKLEDYGEMLNFNIDTAEKKINLTIDLKGEEKPLEVKVNKFEVLNKNGDTFIIVKDAETSKEWMTVLVKQYFLNKEIKVPGKMEPLLKVIL